MNTAYSNHHDEVFRALEVLGELNRRESAAKDKRSSLCFLAVRVPLITQTVRTGFSFYSRTPGEVLSIWDEIWTQSQYFEVMSAALTYYSLNKNIDPRQVWGVLSRWISRVENWAHSDHLANIYSYLLPQIEPLVYPVLVAWNVADSQWLRRVSLISLIHYTGKNAVFMTPDRMFPLIATCVGDTQFYVQRAVGWVLREMSRQYSKEVITFVETNLNNLSTTSMATLTTSKYISVEHKRAWNTRRKSKRRTVR